MSSPDFKPRENSTDAGSALSNSRANRKRRIAGRVFQAGRPNIGASLAQLKEIKRRWFGGETGTRPVNEPFIDGNGRAGILVDATANQAYKLDGHLNGIGRHGKVVYRPSEGEQLAGPVALDYKGNTYVPVTVVGEDETPETELRRLARTASNTSTKHFGDVDTLARLPVEPDCIDVTDDGKTIAIGTHKDLFTLDTESGEVEHWGQLPDDIDSMRYLRDGALAVNTSKNGVDAEIYLIQPGSFTAQPIKVS